MKFHYASTSTSGPVEAESLDRAYNRLRSHITDAMIAEGATLWVEDEATAHRITMLPDGSAKRNFPMPMADVLFTRGLQSAAEVTVIDDGQVRYPVRASDLNAWLAEHGPVTATNYEQFCDEVEAIGQKDVGTVGSAEMIALCAELIEAGAEFERPQ